MNEVKAKVQEMIAAPSCCTELKAAGQAWLDAVGTEKEKEMTTKLLAEIDADIMPIDGLIAFAGSEMGKKIFGEEGAAKVLAHGQEIKAAGGKYCDCAACSAALAVKGMLQ